MLTPNPFPPFLRLSLYFRTTHIGLAMAKHWTLREDEDVESVRHEAMLGSGGYGEVHQVRATLQPAATEIADAEHCYGPGLLMTTVLGCTDVGGLCEEDRACCRA